MFKLTFVKLIFRVKSRLFYVRTCVCVYVYMCAYSYTLVQVYVCTLKKNVLVDAMGMKAIGPEIREDQYNERNLGQFIESVFHFIVTIASFIFF